MTANNLTPPNESRSPVELERAQELHDLNVVAKSWGHTVEFIERQRQRDLIAEILDPARDTLHDYDDVVFTLACQDLIPSDEAFDPLVKLAYLAAREKRTAEEGKRIAKWFASFADQILSFNATEGGEWDDDVIDAVFFTA
jgi:hypothetical protein